MTTSAGLVTAMDRARDADSAEGLPASVAVTVKLVTVPAPFGVPEMMPVLLSRLRPLGSDPELTDQVIGAVPPVEVNVVTG